MTTHTTPRVTSFAPQFLVDDLGRSIAYYRRLGFSCGEPWGGFYAIGRLDGLELHLKEAPKSPAERRYRRDNEHLDAAAGVEGIEAFYERAVANGVKILDGYIGSFGGVAPGEHRAGAVALRVFCDPCHRGARLSANRWADIGSGCANALMRHDR